MILLETNFHNIITESAQDGKKLYLSGVFMESEKRNRNGRIYQRSEMERAVQKINEAAKAGRYVLGELDHPQGRLDICLENVSHKIIEMKMVGDDAIGKAEILTTVPKGQIAKGLIEAGVQLGVSSRGSGVVEESTGKVSRFDIVTVDLVANPSAINAYPISIYESLQLYRRGGHVENLAEAILHDDAAQKYFKKELLKFVESCFKK